MISAKHLVIILAIVVSISAAPVDEKKPETTTTQSANATSTTTTNTTPAPSSSSNDKTPEVPASQAANSTVSEAALLHAHSSFSCQNREMGYYADVERQCKFYFFCLPGEFNGTVVYQRISYMCLNDAVFDQTELDCVKKSSTACDESPKFFESSNEIVRKAVSQNLVVNSTA